jgi:hypothetical protein
VTFFNIVRVSWLALLRHKMRSFLTVLGIIIGVGAVIAMVALGEGAKSEIQRAFEKMGTNMLVVRSGASSSGGARGGFGSQPTLTWADVEALRTEVPSVAMVAPSMRTNAQIVADGANWQTGVEGTTPEFFVIRNWNAAMGTACATGKVCVDFSPTATGVERPEPWQKPICVRRCTNDEDCPTGLPCRDLPGVAGTTWVRGCFPPAARNARNIS